MIGKRLLHYEITKKVGEGGMGEVYLAKDTRLGREVALKILPAVFSQDAERLGRFQREARLLASLNHSQIAHIHGLEEAEATHFLVLEFVDGEDLAERLQRGPFPVDEALDVARQVAEALEVAHDSGIIHRDLKPANIKVTTDGNVKVLDFGLAKALEGEEALGASDTGLSNSPTMMAGGTMQGVILGTAAYMSPEQARGKKVDRRTDIWAFGCVLFEMLTGQKLFSGETVSDTLAGVLRGEIPWDTLPESTPRAVRTLLERCLERDRSQRLQAIGEARIVLDGVAAGKYVETIGDANETSSEGSKPSPLRFVPWVIAVAALALASFAVLRPKESAVSDAKPYLATTIQVPEGNGISTSLHSLALSPDGTKLVYVGANAEGRNQLFVRSLDETKVRPLPGTEGATVPFWSPDSRHVGFICGRQLFRTDIEGEGVKAVVSQEMGGAFEGAWHNDGTIIFVPGTRSSVLSRVDASGGTVEPWLEISSDAEVFIDGPSFTPGGEVLICTVGNWQTNTSEVYAIDYATKEATPLIQGKTTAAYAAGYLLYCRDDDLYAQGLDLATWTLSGNPLSLVADVHVSSFPDHAFFSVNPGQLAYLPGGAASAVMELVWVDRKGEQLGEAIVTGDLYNQRISPDGRRVAIDISTPETAGDLWVLDLARGSSVRLTDHPSDESRPVWINNDEFFFIRGLDTMRMPVSRSVEPTTILEGDGAGIAPNDLSPDGRYVLLREEDEHSILDLESRERVVWGTNMSEPRFSPDGRWIAYESNETGRVEVFVESFPDRSERFRVSVDGGSQPTWRGDGKELYFYSLNKVMMAVPMDMDATDRSPIGEPFELFTTVMRRDDYDVSKDGQRFLLIRPVEQEAPTSIVFVQNWLERVREAQ